MFDFKERFKRSVELEGEDIVEAVMEKAKNGDLKAVEMVMTIVGQKPKDEPEVDRNINVKMDGLADYAT